MTGKSKFPPVGMFGQQPIWTGPQTLVAPGEPLLPPGSPTVQTEPRAQPLTGIVEPYRRGGFVSLSQAVGTASVQFLTQSNTTRNFLYLRNASTAAQNLFIEFAKAATVNSAVRLAPGGFIGFDVVVPQDDLYVISDVAGAVLAYAYSTIDLGP